MKNLAHLSDQFSLKMPFMARQVKIDPKSKLLI